MKMIKFIPLAVVAMLFASCSLDELNRSGVSTEEEWSTAAGYEKLVNNCYFDLIRIIYGQAEDTFVLEAETGTDIWQDVNPTGSNGGWSRLMRYYSDLGDFSETYPGFYATLNNCNAAIAYADRVEGLSQDRINTLVAEAYFLRAHALWNIVEFYGGKYLATTYTASPVTHLECSTINEFYEVILSDLDFAIKYLPAKQEVFGHVTRAAAYHLLARAALSYAAYTDGLGYVDALSSEQARALYQQAQQAADYLIDHASEFGVRLYDDVAEVFDEKNNKSNDEAIFVVCHAIDVTLNPRGSYFNRVWKQFGAYNDSTDGISLGGLQASFDTEVNGVTVPKLAKCNAYAEPSKYMIDLYANRKDQRFDAFFNCKYYINKATSADGMKYEWTETDAKRFKLDLNRVDNHAFDIGLGELGVEISRESYTEAERNAAKHAIYTVEENYKDPAQPGRFFPSLIKHDAPSLYTTTNPAKPWTSADCIIYRLGETYLLSAEANWRLGQTAKAKDRLNALRNRACEGHDGSLDITEAEVTEDFILDEYAREMCGEWLRWFVLKRFRALESRIAKCNPQITSFDKNVHYFRPITTKELLKIDNPDEYKNPGY